MGFDPERDAQRGMSKAEVLSLYPTDFPRQHLERCLSDRDRVLFLSGELEDKSKIWNILSILIALMLAFVIMSLVSLVCSFIFPYDPTNPDSTDYFTLFLVTLVFPLAGLITSTVVFIIPFRFVLLVTQDSIFVIKRGYVGKGRLTKHDLCAVQGSFATHEVDDINYMDFRVDDPDKIAEETRSMNVNGLIGLPGFRGGIAVHNCPELVATLSDLLDLKPIHTISSDRVAARSLLLFVTAFVVPYDIFFVAFCVFFFYPFVFFFLLLLGSLLNLCFVRVILSFFKSRNYTLSYCFPVCYGRC